MKTIRFSYHDGAPGRYKCNTPGDCSGEYVPAVVAGDLLAACRKAAMSCHHPACNCKGENSANPERYCTCHVQVARAAIAAAEADDQPAGPGVRQHH